MSIHTPIESEREKPPGREQVPGERAGVKDHVLAFLAACGMIGPVLYIVTWIVAGLLYPGYSQLDQATSLLTARGAPPAAAAVANFGGIALGLSIIALAFGLYRGVRRSRWLLAGVILLVPFGLICIAQTLFPMDPGAGASSWQNVMHGVMFTISGVLIPALLVLSVAFARDPSFRPYRWYTLITPFAMVLVAQDVGFFPAGVPERLANLVVLAWIEVVAIRLLWLTFHREPEPGDRDDLTDPHG